MIAELKQPAWAMASKSCAIVVSTRILSVFGVCLVLPLLLIFISLLLLLSPQRKKEVNDRGIEATRVGDGVQVRIDKDKWSRANGGAEISASKDRKTGDSKMTIKSPDGDGEFCPSCLYA